MPRIRRIVIKKGNADGTLDLGNDKIKRAWKSDFVVWRIRENSGVQSITKIVVKPKNVDVFVTTPYENGSEWFGQVKSTVEEGMECEYAIHWTDAAGNARVHDPIITIKPSLFDDDIESAIGIIAGATIGAAATFLLEGSALVERVAALIVGAVIGGFAGWLFLRKR